MGKQEKKWGREGRWKVQSTLGLFVALQGSLYRLVIERQWKWLMLTRDLCHPLSLHKALLSGVAHVQWEIGGERESVQYIQLLLQKHRVTCGKCLGCILIMHQFQLLTWSISYFTDSMHGAYPITHMIIGEVTVCVVMFQSKTTSNTLTGTTQTVYWDPLSYHWWTVVVYRRWGAYLPPEPGHGPLPVWRSAHQEIPARFWPREGGVC